MSTHEPIDINGLPDFDTLQKIEQEKEKQQKDQHTQTQEPQPIAEAKYFLVPTFWRDASGIECIDVIGSFNPETGIDYVQFIDIYGRMGKIRAEYVGISFINYPTKEDIDEFQRLKREAKLKEEERKNKKNNNKDIDKNRDTV